VPHRHGGYRGGGGYGHYQDGGRYQSGPVYVQPVPRR